MPFSQLSLEFDGWEIYRCETQLLLLGLELYWPCFICPYLYYDFCYLEYLDFEFSFIQNIYIHTGRHQFIRTPFEVKDADNILTELKIYLVIFSLSLNLWVRFKKLKFTVWLYRKCQHFPWLRACFWGRFSHIVFTLQNRCFYTLNSYIIVQQSV